MGIPKTWEIIVFTQGSQAHAERACKDIFSSSESKRPFRILSRHYCTFLGTSKIKEIRRYRPDPGTFVIGDDNPKFIPREDLHNFVPIKPWRGKSCERDDTELLKIGHLIIELNDRQGDVRLSLRDIFKRNLRKHKEDRMYCHEAEISDWEAMKEGDKLDALYSDGKWYPAEFKEKHNDDGYVYVIFDDEKKK